VELNELFLNFSL